MLWHNDIRMLSFCNYKHTVFGCSERNVKVYNLSSAESACLENATPN